MTTLLFQDDFTALTNWTGSVTSVAGRNGNGMQCSNNSSGQWVVSSGAQSNKWTLGFAVQLSNLTANRPICQLRTTGTVNQLTLTVLTTGAIAVQRGGTSGAAISTSATGLITTGTWYFIEFSASLSDTIGTVEVRINGATAIGPLVNQDTIFSGTPTVFNELCLTSNSGNVSIFDDLYCTDDVFLGDGVPPRSISVCNAVLDEPFNNLSAWVNNNGAGATISPARTGMGLRILNSGTGGVNYTIPSALESDYATCGFAFKFETMSFGPTMFAFVSDAGATIHCSLQLDPTGVVQLRRATSNTLATSVGILAVNTWYFIEVQARVHDTLGFMTMAVNGVPFVGVSGVDTKNAGTKTTIDGVRLNANSGTPCLFDDLYIRTGSSCSFRGDSALGPSFSYILSPEGNPASWNTQTPNIQRTYVLQGPSMPVFPPKTTGQLWPRTETGPYTLVQLTQAAYDALPVKDPYTFYIIVP